MLVKGMQCMEVYKILLNFKMWVQLKELLGVELRISS